MTIWPALFQVCGLLWALTMLGVLGGVSGSESAAYFGVQCEFSNNARCLANAVCVSPRTCRCEQGDGSEDGSFFCPGSTQQHVELVGSNQKFFAWNSSVKAPVVLDCRTRITELTIERPVDQPTCTFQIFTENEEVANNVYVKAVELHIKIQQLGDTQYEGAVRLSPGGVMQDVYTYKQETKPTFEEEAPEQFTELPDNELVNSGSGMGEFLDDEDGDEEGDSDGAPEDDSDYSDDWNTAPVLSSAGSTDGLIIKGVDSNSVAFLKIPTCGMELRFRTADAALLSAGLSPGVAIALDDTVESVHFSEPNTYLAGTPLMDITSGLKTEYQVSQTDVFLHTALNYAAIQNDDDQGEICKEAGFVYRAYCSTFLEKMNALKTCSFILSDPNIRSCLRTSTIHDGALHAFKRCIWMSCQPTANVCSLFRNEFMSENCFEEPEKDLILSSCPITS